MDFTIDQVIEHQERLAREIAERESLLTVFKVLYSCAAIRLLRDAPASLPPSMAETFPIPAPAPPYLHPDLQSWQDETGGLSAAVRWAIERMTADYSLREIHALLKREGFFIRPGQVSAVLTRLRKRGEIEMIQYGHGPTPDTYRGPAPVILPETHPADVMSDPATTAAAASEG
jgi:hypothetical protein